MSRIVGLRNRQRVRAVDTRLLRRIARWALEELFRATEYELGVHLVGAAEMTRLNEQFLNHEGSTDVITFDHRETGGRALTGAATVRTQAEIASRDLTVAATKGSRPAATLRIHGEIFLCLDEAVAQARRFGTDWQNELARYLLHGLLHLHGFDDLKSHERRRMKREENRLLRLAQQQFPLRRLARPRR